MKEEPTNCTKPMASCKSNNNKLKTKSKQFV